MAPNVPKLRLLVGGTVIEGQQVGLEDLTEVERAGASELITFLGGPKRVIILQPSSRSGPLINSWARP